MRLLCSYWFFVLFTAGMLLSCSSHPRPELPEKYWNNNVQYGTLTDSRDGKTYRTVQIGTQTWMAENLNYAVDSSWCYDNEPDSCAKYGRLYQWLSAMTSCPTGWHLPSDDEWQTLYDYVNANNGDEGVGTSLKSTSGWWYDGNGTDRFGFSALPAGYRYNDGSFHYVSSNAAFWSSSELDANYAWYRNLNSGYDDLFRYYYLKKHGYSVRCLKDLEPGQGR